MRIYDMQSKEKEGWGFWGDYGEIEIGLSHGLIKDKESFTPDRLHYHKRGIIYILVTGGEGEIEVNGKNIALREHQLLKIDAGEPYRHMRVLSAPFSWITICTIKDDTDKVIIA